MLELGLDGFHAGKSVAHEQLTSRLPIVLGNNGIRAWRDNEQPSTPGHGYRPSSYIAETVKTGIMLSAMLHKEKQFVSAAAFYQKAWKRQSSLKNYMSPVQTSRLGYRLVETLLSRTWQKTQHKYATHFSRTMSFLKSMNSGHWF